MKAGLLEATVLVALLPLTFAAAQQQRSGAVPVQGYPRLVYLHLQNYKGFPATAYGAPGRVIVKFTLERGGDVVSSTVLKSSGNAALDQEALAIVRRAKPFPRFPANEPRLQASFAAPINFRAGGSVCQPGTMVQMQDGKMHLCQ